MSQEKNPARCATCPAFELRDIGVGECRAAPPAMVAMSDGRTARFFPPVASDDWCARHPVIAARMVPLSVVNQ